MSLTPRPDPNKDHSSKLPSDDPDHVERSVIPGDFKARFGFTEDVCICPNCMIGVPSNGIRYRVFVNDVHQDLDGLVWKGDSEFDREAAHATVSEFGKFAAMNPTFRS